MSHDLEEACKDVDIAVLLSGLPPRRSMEDFIMQSREMYRSCSGWTASVSRPEHTELDCNS